MLTLVRQTLKKQDICIDSKYFLQNIVSYRIGFNIHPQILWYSSLWGKEFNSSPLEVGLDSLTDFSRRAYGEGKIIMLQWKSQADTTLTKRTRWMLPVVNHAGIGEIVTSWYLYDVMSRALHLCDILHSNPELQSNQRRYQTNPNWESVKYLTSILQKPRPWKTRKNCDVITGCRNPKSHDDSVHHSILMGSWNRKWMKSERSLQFS